MTQKPPRAGGPYRAYKDLLWNEVRRRYLEGSSAPELCAEFGLTLSTFRYKASQAKWRRRDNPPPPPPPDPRDAAEQAIRSAQLAAARGDYAEAEKQSRIAERFDRMAMRMVSGGSAADMNSICPHCGAGYADPPAEPVDFQAELEMRINRFQLDLRQQRDVLKQRNRPEWDRQYAEAKAVVLAQVEAMWAGDARLFDHPHDEDAPAPAPG